MTNNLNSEDTAIAKVASELQNILNDEEAAKILGDSLNALRDISDSIAETLALPYVAQRFLQWTKTYPKLEAVGEVFGSLLIGGLTALGIFNLFSAFKDWKDLSDAQKAQVVIQASQLGLEIVAGVVKRGVRIWAIFKTESLSNMQRAGAVSKILATGEADALDQELVKVGNTAARWIADTEGTVGKFATEPQYYGEFYDMVWFSADTAEEAGLAAKIFGRNLDEFIATRIGPVFILAGIGLSIYFIAKGEAGIPLASDILNIVGGAFMMFATIGGWAVQAGVVTSKSLAAIFSFAGALAVLAALAGVGLMIYEMLQKPQDPAQEFLDNYARPARLALSSQSGSIDYAVRYSNPDQDGLMMIGFSLSANQQYLLANNDGSISLGSATALPNCIWASQTDGLGMSSIGTVVQPDNTKPPVPVLLSLMSDNSVSFQPAMPPPTPSTSAPSATVPQDGGPTIVTQTWFSAPVGSATLTSDGHLASIQLTFQPVIPDGNGNYLPSQASGWLVQTGQGVGFNQTTGTTFVLRMSGMAVNYIRMVNLNFILNSTPEAGQTYGPAFGVLPSAPLSYSMGGQLPPFLKFSPQTGTFAPDGITPASSKYSSNNSIAASNNARGADGLPVTGTAAFTITVTAPSPPPTAVAAEGMSVVA